jgi:hypothetical protein
MHDPYLFHKSFCKSTQSLGVDSCLGNKQVMLISLHQMQRDYQMEGAKRTHALEIMLHSDKPFELGTILLR